MWCDRCGCFCSQEPLFYKGQKFCRKCFAAIQHQGRFLKWKKPKPKATQSRPTTPWKKNVFASKQEILGALPNE